MCAWIHGKLYSVITHGSVVLCHTMRTSRYLRVCLSVYMARYAPGGGRSCGPIRASTLFGNYHREIENNVIIFAMVETKEAVDNITAIASTPGLTGIYVGDRHEFGDFQNVHIDSALLIMRCYPLFYIILYLCI